MAKSDVYKCQCANCKQITEHIDKKIHHQMNLFLSRCDEQQRRWYVAIESKKIGYGGEKLLSEITGIDEKTIRRGIEEIETELKECPEGNIRLPGAGRPTVEKKIP